MTTRAWVLMILLGGCIVFAADYFWPEKSRSPRLEILELVEQGDHAAVAARLEQTYAGIGPGGFDQFAIADEHYNAGYYEEAGRNARRAAELAPNESYPLLRLAMAYNKQFDCAKLHEAISSFLASCKSNRDCSETNIEWGQDSLEVIETLPTCEQWRQQRNAPAHTSNDEI